MTMQTKLNTIILCGRLVGSSTPSKETKGAYYEVYLLDNQLYAVVIDDREFGGAVSYEEILEHELGLYVDDVEAATKAYKEAFQILK